MRAYQTLDQKIRKMATTALATGLVLATISVGQVYAASGYTAKDGKGVLVNTGVSSTTGIVNGQTIVIPRGGTIGYKPNGEPVVISGYISLEAAQEVQEQTKLNEEENKTNLEVYINLGLNEKDLPKKLKIYQEAERQIDSRNIRGPPDKIEKVLEYLAITYRNLGELENSSKTYMKLHQIFPDTGYNFAAKNVLKKR